jgi:predicted transcriptional regulator
MSIKFDGKGGYELTGYTKLIYDCLPNYISAIAKKLNKNPSLVSYHLNILDRRNIIEKTLLTKSGSIKRVHCYKPKKNPLVYYE